MICDKCGDMLVFYFGGFNAWTCDSIGCERNMKKYNPYERKWYDLDGNKI